jgi:hypothetical protein
MTTYIDRRDRPELPHPSRYTRHADYIHARIAIEREWQANRRRDRRNRWLLLILLGVLAIFLLT